VKKQVDFLEKQKEREVVLIGKLRSSLSPSLSSLRHARSTAPSAPALSSSF